MKYKIVKATEARMAAVAEIEKERFSTPWTVENFCDALIREDNIFLCAVDDESVKGYVLLYTMADEGEVATIATATSSEGQGIGEALLKEALFMAADRGVTQVFLEVRVSNAAALHLYDKCGFAIVGTRKGFYRLPDEDAYVCAYHMEGLR